MHGEGRHLVADTQQEKFRVVRSGDSYKNANRVEYEEKSAKRFGAPCYFGHAGECVKAIARQAKLMHTVLALSRNYDRHSYVLKGSLPLPADPSLCAVGFSPRN